MSSPHTTRRTIRCLAAFALLAPCVRPAMALVDTNGNGLCDVWEMRYLAHGASAAADEDGDGFDNAKEAEAGTDPRDPASRLEHRALAWDGSTIGLDVVSQKGKRYRLLGAPSPGGPWVEVAGPVVAAGETVSFSESATPGHQFWRVEATDTDGDGDGVSDWGEDQLAGFDAGAADSFPGAPGDDLAAASQVAQALFGGGVGAVVSAAAAHEKEGSAAVVSVARSGDTALPLAVYFQRQGAAASNQSSAGMGDYTLQDGAGAALADRVVIPAGSASAEIRVLPVADALAEVPEHLRFSFGFAASTSDVSVCDAANAPENARLFVAYLAPRPGVAGLGSGLATVRLQGDNDAGVVTVSFTNLTGPVNSTQIQVGGGGILQSIPPFNYGGHTWSIRASQFYATDQEVLDALFAGGLLLNIFTENYLGGEIAGTFGLTNGSTEFQEPPDPPAIAALTGSPLDREIVRFLTQATFGPTTEDIAALQALVAARGGDRIAAFGEWIDAQLAAGSPSLLAYLTAADAQERALYGDPQASYYDPDYQPRYDNRRRGWWLLARHAPDQLRQRVAFALSEVFVTSGVDSLLRDRAYGMAHYYDMLKSGAFGSYRELLEGVSKHPIMGAYLSHLRNHASLTDEAGNVIVSPDENYAREIMQLFSIGLVRLFPDGSLEIGADGLPLPTYGQGDITELARVFTGWSFSKRNNPSTSTTVVDNTDFNYGNGRQYYESQWMHPMKMFEDNGLAPSNANYIRYHDNGAKSFLGLDIPAGQTGEQDMESALDHLAGHANVAPFLCRRLIQRLVDANPSPGYIHRVAGVFQSTGGNLGQTVKAILLDYEARELSIADGAVSSGKPREPILRYLALARAFDAKSNLPLADLLAHGYPQAELDLFPEGTTRVRLGDTDGSLGQTPQEAPSVFNWFLPDYIPPGDLSNNGIFAPEFQIANESSVVGVTNHHYSLLFGTNGQGGNALPNQASANDDNLILDIEPLRALYLAVLDENGDGTFNNLDAGTFNNPAKIAEAVEAVVDHCDNLLCAGALKARYGSTPGQPRQIILDAVNATRALSNGNTNNQATYMNDRIRNAVYLVITSPEFIAQK